MKRTGLYLAATTLLLVVSGLAIAQDQKGAAAKSAAAPAAGGARAADEQAIRAASQALAAAFSSGNAQSLAALFTEEAEYVSDDSEPVKGRANLAKAYEGFFAKRKEIKSESKTDSIRFLGSDTAVEEGTFTVTAKDSPASSAKFSSLYVRQGGKWLIALLKEWSDETTARPNLSDLSWLIGTWESDGPEMTARTTYEWAGEKTFIKSQYTLTPKKAGEKASSGVQVIGVDPAVGQIRGWLFAADGGIGESTWVWDEDRWMIESVGTLADGSRTTSVNILARTGNDTFSWRSVSRNVAGQPQPDVAAVTVKRVGGAAPPPQASR